MMCSGGDPQMGSNNSSSDWTHAMMMNMPATDSPSTATPPASAATATATSSSLSSAAAAAKAMTQAAGPLRCPRCDSANTKFCYYNNYSLSQPRHFCKACKRYWTRGGTLRNVPVGGGCRKNKRVKKQHQHQPTTTATATVTVNSDPLPSPPPLPPPTSSDLSSFFYGLTTSDMNMNLGGTAANAYDALGLGGLIPASASNQLMNSTNLADLQRQPSSCSFLHYNDQYPSGFGSQAPSTLKHVLMSSLKQQPKKAEDQYGQSLLPYDSSGANLGFLNDVKVEGDHGNLNNLMRHNISTECQAGGGYPFETNINGGATDASFLYWNPATGGAAGWPDAPNSSVAPLI